jgi:dihydrodipicolinate synthase/N-acetylneuraminate lyase
MDAMRRYPSCLLATCCVPWDEAGQFMEEVFRCQVHTMLTRGTKHLYVFGTAGEGYAVSDRQFDQVVGVFADAMRSGGAEPMVGVIGLALTTITERIDRARAAGVRLFQISLPSWGGLTERELFTFFAQTCGRFPDCQFLHYNLLRTKRLVTPREYARLAKEHPNLVATKNSTDAMDLIEELLLVAPQLQHFLTETGYAYGSLISECGLLASLATLNWTSGRTFFEAGQRRDVATLQAMLRELNALGRELVAVVGNSAHIDGAFDKLFCRLHDRCFPLRLLPPYEYVSETSFERFAALLREKYPRWVPGEPAA